VPTDEPGLVGLRHRWAFGEWGEGKSYFLRMVKQQVATTARGNDAYTYHDVRQVEFNAWHYAETGASLIAEIFAQLAKPRGDHDDLDLGAEQRKQSRLVSEIVAERRLPERIAAER
jgi:hypothetical protein